MEFFYLFIIYLNISSLLLTHFIKFIQVNHTGFDDIESYFFGDVPFTEDIFESKNFLGYKKKMFNIL